MKPEFQKLLNLFEELEVAGETVSLTIQSREGKSTIKLQLESQSPPSHSSTATPTIPAASAPVPGRRRRHRGAAARARRRQRAADHQGTTLAAPASAPAPHQQYHPPLRHPPHLLPSPSPSSGRRRVMSLGRLPLPSFGSLNLDGHCTWQSREPEVVKPQVLKLCAPPPLPPLPPPPPPPPPPSLRVRLRNGWSDVHAEVIKNLSEDMKASIWDAHYNGEDGRLSLSRSFTCSSSSASSSLSSISNHSQGSSPYCSDEDLFEDLGRDVDSDRC